MRFIPGEVINIPSPIDVHVHLREPGGTDRETIESGTHAALHGGYQAVFDMPNNPGGMETRTLARLDEKQTIAERTAHVDIGFYAGINLDEPDFEELAAMLPVSAGLKLYMDHTTGNATARDLDSVRPVIDAWIAQGRQRRNQPPILLHAREDVGHETAMYTATQGYPVHWAHLSTRTEAHHSRHLTKAFPGFYTGGVTPHHLTMTERNADFQQGWNGARMQPPLGREVDAEALLRAYNDGDIQILETDHAPHTETDKLHAEEQNPTGDTDPACTTCYGVGGIEFVLPVMFSLVQRGKVDMERLVDSLHDQPRRLLSLRRDADIGATTRLRIEPYVIGEADVAGMSMNTPYVNWTAWARVLSVTRRGRETQLTNPLGSDYEKHSPARILHAGSIL